jgi:hypothetical protein
MNMLDLITGLLQHDPLLVRDILEQRGKVGEVRL